MRYKIVVISREMCIHGKIPFNLVRHRVTPDEWGLRAEDAESQLLHLMGANPLL